MEKLYTFINLHMADHQVLKIVFESGHVRIALFLCVAYSTVQKISTQYIFDERSTNSTSYYIVLEREKLHCLIIHHTPED